MREKQARKTRRIAERRETLARPGTMRRRYDPQSQRTIFAPSRPNKRSREEIAEIDAELTYKANRIVQAEQNTVDTEEECNYAG